MADGGPVQEWLAAHLEDPRTTVLLCGYCGKGTLGAELGKLGTLAPAELARLQEPVSLLDVELRACDIKARVVMMTGFSGHADQAGLVDWAFPTNRDKSRFPVAKRLLLTHGEAASRRALRDALLDYSATSGLAIEVDLPRPGGPGIDVRTGEPVAREVVLGIGAPTERPEELSLDEALREVKALRSENARLRLELVEARRTNSGGAAAS